MATPLMVKMETWKRDRQPILAKFITAVCVTGGQLLAATFLVIQEADVH
jgi:hypothetical protein